MGFGTAKDSPIQISVNYQIALILIELKLKLIQQQISNKIRLDSTLEWLSKVPRELSII